MGAREVSDAALDSDFHTRAGDRVAVIIPAYRARETIRTVVQDALFFGDFVVVIDDACPDFTGDMIERNPRVSVLRHAINRGVGGAMKTGIAEALRIGCTYIVKIDADGQMDASRIPNIIRVFEKYPEIGLVKGNRFAFMETLRSMPKLRLVGNSILTLLVKISSGYWTLVDPTNGFLGLRVRDLATVNVERLADRYFFEIDLICAWGLNRRTIGEIEMPAIYDGARSSLSIAHTAMTFPGLLYTRALRRLVLNYFIYEINVGSLCLLVGLPLLIFSVLFGTHEWMLSAQTGMPRTTGTVILALLTFVMGFQLTLQAVLFDIQWSPRTIKLPMIKTEVSNAVNTNVY